MVARQEENVVALITSGERAKRAFDLWKFRYGDVVSHRWLRTALDLPQEDDKSLSVDQYKTVNFQYAAAMNELKRLLGKKKKQHLDNLRGEGYRVILPQDQTDWALAEAKDALRKSLSEANFRLRHLDTDGLTDTARAENADAKARMSKIGGFVRKTLRRKEAK